MIKVLSAVLVAVLALVIIGCGKSAEQQKLEAEMVKSVMDMVGSATTSLGQVDGLAGQLQSVLGQHDSLVAKYPNQTAGHNADDLKAAQEKLMAAKETMSTWIGGFKKYDLNMKHDELIAKLKKDKEDLTGAIGKLEGAMSAATTAVDSHKKMAGELLASVTKKLKK